MLVIVRFLDVSILNAYCEYMLSETASPLLRHASIALSPSTARSIAADHAFGHRLLMSMLPSNVFNSESPRAEAGLLWGFTSPTTLHVVSRLPLSSARDTEMTDIPTPSSAEAGQALLVTGIIEASQMKATWIPEEIWNLPQRPNAHGKRVPVAAEDLRSWLAGKLARSGFELTEVLSLADRRIPVKKRNITAADFTVKATVADPTLAQHALDHGCGRSKNFGLGLLRATPM